MDPQGQLTILDYWRVVWRSRWLILALAVVATIVSFGVARTLPKVYTAKATVLAPKESASQNYFSLGAMYLGASERQEGQRILPGISFGLPSITTNTDIFVALLKSRTMKEEVLAGLAKSWGPAVGSMVVSIQPDVKEKGIISLTVEARDPKLAAEMANFYFSHLDRMLQRYADQALQQRENFLTAQLDLAAKEVETAEAAVLKFQSENRFLPVDPSAKREVESVAMGRGTIMALELQLETMRLRFTDQHPQIIELKKQIAELKRQYSKSLFGGAMDLPPESPTAKGSRKEFFVPAAKMTPVQFAFLKLYRNLKIQEAFYTAALQGLQQIKYGEGGFSPRVEILDPALPPLFRSWPNIRLVVAVAAIGALIAGILLAFFLDYLARLREQERQTRPPLPARGRRSGDGAEPPSIPERRRVSAVESGAGVGGRALGSPVSGGE